MQPIALGELSIGRLALAPRHPADPREVDLAKVIARELAGPIRMATLVEESQRLARIDALTGLMNRRAFLSVLNIEIERVNPV